MDMIQRSVLAMSSVTIEFIDDTESSIISGIPHFETHYTPFKDNVRLLNRELVLQMMNRGGYAIDKKDIKEEMCLLGDAISDDVVAYAVNSNNSILEEEVSFTYSELIRFGDAECAAANQLIYDKAKFYLADLVDYNVDDAMLTTYLHLIDSYRIATPTPKNQRIDKKMATNEIRDLFSANSVYLKKMDKLVKLKKRSNPEFVSHYFASRTATKPGYRTLAARILVVDEDGNPLEKVLITNKGIGLKRRTTVKGQLYLKHLEDHVYVLVFSKSDYITQEVKLPITKGERAELKVKMQRVENEELGISN